MAVGSPGTGAPVDDFHPSPSPQLPRGAAAQRASQIRGGGGSRIGEPVVSLVVNVRRDREDPTVVTCELKKSWFHRGVAGHHSRTLGTIVVCLDQDAEAVVLGSMLRELSLALGDALYRL